MDVADPADGDGAVRTVTPTKLVIGSPAHLPHVWIHLANGRVYYVATCGARGESLGVPSLLTTDQSTCPLCFAEHHPEATA